MTRWKLEVCTSSSPAPPGGIWHCPVHPDAPGVVQTALHMLSIMPVLVRCAYVETKVATKCVKGLQRRQVLGVPLVYPIKRSPFGHRHCTTGGTLFNTLLLL